MFSNTASSHICPLSVSFRVLPTSTEDGLVEFIKDSSVLSQVLAKHKTITNFLKLHNPDPEGLYWKTMSGITFTGVYMPSLSKNFFQSPHMWWLFLRPVRAASNCLGDLCQELCGILRDNLHPWRWRPAPGAKIVATCTRCPPCACFPDDLLRDQLSSFC